MAARNRRRRIGRWLLRVLLAFVAVSLLLVVPLRWIDPVTSAFMLRHRLIASWNEDYRPPRQQWTDMDTIAPSLGLAVVAAEDQKFPSHAGFDLGSIVEAIESHLFDDEPLRGASTISQQVVKNLYLWPAQNFLRKGLEAWMTVLIEIALPKRRILELYLNLAQFGPDTYGAAAAAERFFGVTAARLTAEQAALLASALPNPRRFRVASPSAYMRERQRWILGQMRALGGAAWLEQALSSHRNAYTAKRLMIVAFIVRSGR